jgi:hypothetical protein
VPNAAALKFISAEDRADPALYPAKAVLALCELPFYEGERIGACMPMR